MSYSEYNLLGNISKHDMYKLHNIYILCKKPDFWEKGL